MLESESVILTAMQNIIILVLFLVSFAYVARMIYRSFTRKNACASGCGKCGIDFSKIEQQLQKKA